jgi:hypothetical protein
MEKKTCSKCKIEKDFCEFRKATKEKSGYQSECKLCAKLRYDLNREKILHKKKIYTLKNKEKKSEYDKKYRLKNKDKKNEYIRNYRKNRRLNDSTFRVIESVRSRIKNFLKSKNIQIYNNTFKIVGCSPKQLKEFLETKFVGGMTWDNYGKWHIDHIIPLSSAVNNDDVYNLCHYTNLQPLWSEDNIKKSNKIIKN